MKRVLTGLAALALLLALVPAAAATPPDNAGPPDGKGKPAHAGPQAAADDGTVADTSTAPGKSDSAGQPTQAGKPDDSVTDEEIAVPDRVADLKLKRPINIDGITKIGKSVLHAKGKVRVSIRLSVDPVSVAAASGASKAALRSQERKVESQQRSFDAALAAVGARKIASVQNVLNAVFVEVDASALLELAAHPSVVSIKAVGKYHVVLSETVPYIGAETVHTDGYDGTGVRVAVLDSGVDYTHEALGGSGLVADYEAATADPTTLEGGWPQGFIVGGYDYVGSDWPNTDEAPDEDPIDDGSEAGHGTHVAHIIGGVGGVAPGVDLYSVKVCSSVSTSCSGIALIQGIDFALNPDGDTATDDHVDVINMSLGADYGQAFDDDLSLAVDNATAVGVLTVASAGNGGDKPYIVGTPSATPTALSVAQTNVPSAVEPQIEAVAPEAIAGSYPAVFQPWSAPLASLIEAPMIFGDGAGGNPLGCDPFTTDLTGYIVLVDRGACNFTLKISNISQAGGEAGIIGLVAPGEPFSGGDGGDRPIDIPGYMITQDLASLFKSGLPDTVLRLDPGTGTPLISTMVGSSSRGPTVQFNNLVKPEIGAPGASVSAIAGSGTDTGPFGGTSGAAPMVTGSAALLLQANPSLSPLEAKAVLVNTGETGIKTKPNTGLAPIARIGGGEVRADRAVATSAAAWDNDSDLPTLSYGFVDAYQDMTLTKTVKVMNYGVDPITYDIEPTFRYNNDDTGAVTVTTSTSSVNVPAGGSATFDVSVHIDASALDDWYGNSGSLGADASWLNDLEYDGYVWLDAADDANDIHVPWHVLPRKSSDVQLDTQGKNRFQLTNTGAGTALVEAYNLVATSADLPEGTRGGQAPITDFRAIGYLQIPVPAGFCSAQPSYLLAFAVNTWERQTHANVPNAHDLYLDYDGDGTPEANIFNYELAGDLSDGRNVVIAVDLVAGTSSIWFFTDHETNSANTVLYACAEQIGLHTGQTNSIKMAVGGAYDLYFTGNYTDFFGSIQLSGNSDTPVTYQGAHVDTIALPPGASAGGTLAGNTGALFLIRGGAPDGSEALIMP